ncbi:molecular chaperone DnaK [Lysinibacillus sp. 2017]|uniref:TraR/DksA C4-type zinc finger protein n=1 Tax=unclassified Lysinibacillus TaxID=2636778 RepID=UPI000D529A1B|nr:MULTISPECIES: TraR/DksA C4-type zinc finger protein [unclassified Lysinibacillus]AWE08419.1 molecular chaperone DnaK [Lysinibacillus sp. 2017]TGN35734.1 molecular chaperone DnaK [Lysinibacillus sp. S2017]
MEKKKLQKLRTALKDELATLSEHINEEPIAEESELTSVDNHPADVATDLTTVTTEIALDELKEEEMEKIQTALRAIDEETYGKCTECGKEIPFERLEAVPTTLTCIEHAEDVEI